MESIFMEINAVTSNVVLNDKPVGVESLNNQVDTVLDSLVKQRKEWEGNAYRASNQQLYSILAKCYALDWEISNGTADRKVLRKSVDRYADKIGYSFKGSTPTLTRIIRCVFGNVNRSRISTYSLVLRAAKIDQVQITDLPTYIENAGGIQEIRLSKSSTYKSPKLKSEIAQKAVNDNTLAIIKSTELSKKTNPEEEGETCVLIATQQADGGFTIHSVVRSKTALQAALLAYYSESGDVAEKIKKESAANDEKYRVDIVNKIIN